MSCTHSSNLIGKKYSPLLMPLMSTVCCLSNISPQEAQSYPN